MSQETVRRSIALSGHDERDLEERLLLVRQALRARSGTVVKIEWSPPSRDSLQHATVFYELAVEPGLAQHAR